LALCDHVLESVGLNKEVVLLVDFFFPFAIGANAACGVRDAKAKVGIGRVLVELIEEPGEEGALANAAGP